MQRKSAIIFSLIFLALVAGFLTLRASNHPTQSEPSCCEKNCPLKTPSGADNDATLPDRLSRQFI